MLFLEISGSLGRSMNAFSFVIMCSFNDYACIKVKKSSECVYNRFSMLGKGELIK